MKRCWGWTFDLSWFDSIRLGPLFLICECFLMLSVALLPKAPDSDKVSPQPYPIKAPVQVPWWPRYVSWLTSFVNNALQLTSLFKNIQKGSPTSRTSAPAFLLYYLYSTKDIWSVLPCLAMSCPWQRHNFRCTKCAWCHQVIVSPFGRVLRRHLTWGQDQADRKQCCMEKMRRWQETHQLWVPAASLAEASANSPNGKGQNRQLMKNNTAILYNYYERTTKSRFHFLCGPAWCFLGRIRTSRYEKQSKHMNWRLAIDSMTTYQNLPRKKGAPSLPQELFRPFM